MHFEQLWEESENFLKEETKTSSFNNLMIELDLKLKVYSSLENNISLSLEEKQRVKSHVFGKILLLLTQLSWKDNINTFMALKIALDETKIDLLTDQLKLTNT